MKVQIDILEDQIELLNKIKQLPNMIQNHLGKLPQAFPGGLYEMGEIQQRVANLEFNCKKMIFDTCIVKEQLSDILNDTHLASPKYRKPYQDSSDDED